MTISNQDVQEREAERDMAVAAIAATMNVIAEKRRHPDEWERVHLLDAVMAIFSGCYTLSAARAHLALTPTQERSRTTILPKDAIYGRCELPLLSQLLTAAQQEPVKTFPSFGPIQIPLPPAAPGKAWLK